MIALPSRQIYLDFAGKYAADAGRFAVEVCNQEPTHQQFELYDAVSEAGCRVSAVSGHGCFGLGTPIMLASGEVRPVEAIAVGDRLMGGDGRSERRVLELYRGRERMYRFTYSDGGSHVFNESHILCLVATNSKGRRIAGERTTVTVREWLTWGADKRRCHAVYRAGVEAFIGSGDELPIPPYILGAWLGDGSSRDPEITTADPEILDAFVAYAESWGGVVKHRSDTGAASTWAIRNARAYSRDSFGDELRKLGLRGNKHIPAAYLCADRASRLELLAGLIDTDGFLDNAGAGFDIVQKSEQMARGIVWLARSVGCHATVREVTKQCVNNGVRGQYWRVTIGRNIACIPVRVARKRPYGHRQRPNLHFGIRSAEPLGEGDYYGFELDGDHRFLGGDFTVLHNTGKTRAFGVIGLWHLLCYFSNSNQGSETVISAPKVDQVRKGVWREAAVALNELQRGPHAWLRPYVILNSQRIYVRDFKETWFIHAKTAPRGSPDNVSGSHADWLLILTDETAGIPDGVMSRFTGALTDKRNRIACASQGSRNSGFFWETHHKVSTKQGGAWKALHFDGEKSPLVSRENLREKEDEYGGRDSVEYKVRVRGLFPVDSENYLLGRTEIERCYGIGRIIAAADNPGWLIGFDVAGGGWRNKSVLIIARVTGNEEFGPDARRMEIVKIIRRGGTDPIEMGGIALSEARGLANSAVLIDAVGQGWPVYKNMEEQGVAVHAVMWGKPNFRKNYKERFLNQRAQANAFAARAAREGRLSILTDECKTDLILEASRIPRKFDGRGKQFIMSKEDMEKEGIPSPDLWDAVSFLFLEWAHYTPSGEEIAGGTGTQIRRAVKEAEDAFAGVP